MERKKLSLMKLSEILVLNHLGTKKQVKKLIKQGLIYTKTKTIVEDTYINEDIYFQDQKLDRYPLKYYMFYKPLGYESSHKSDYYKSIYDLYPYQNHHIIGRLDVNTSGLILFTNDLKLRKKLLLPEFSIERTYVFTSKYPYSDNDIKQVSEGIIINKQDLVYGKIERIDLQQGYIKIYEGKYHEIRKIFLSLNNEIVSLKRISYAHIPLDIAEGEYRALTQEEINVLKGQVTYRG